MRSRRGAAPVTPPAEAGLGIYRESIVNLPGIIGQWEPYQRVVRLDIKEGKEEVMVATDRTSKKHTHNQKRRKLPSPALCCACGLCVLLAGLNITLVGAFAFTTLVPSANPPIIIGPVLLLVAFSFFGACCVCSRLVPAPGAQGSQVGGRGGGLMGQSGRSGGVAFEIETSEHTLQDTTAVQLSPTPSPGSSRASSPEGAEPPSSPPPPVKVSASNGPSCVSAVYSASAPAEGEVRLNLPREDVTT